MHLSEDESAEFSARRAERFEEHGLAGIDIETMVDTEYFQICGNFRPYSLCISGTLQRIEHYTDEDGHERMRRVTDKNVNAKFWGTYCIVQFVDFLVQHGYFQTTKATYTNRMQRYEKRVPKVYNTFFAHNGFKFDFRFLYQELYSRMGDFQVVGCMTAMKQVRGQGICLMDTSLVIPGSLKDIAEAMFKGDESRHKLKNEKIKSLTAKEFRTLSVEDKDDIEKYCMQDAYVVKEIAREFFLQIYTTDFNGCGFIQRPFHHSSASLAWQVWSICFLDIDIYTNKEALPAE